MKRIFAALSAIPMLFSAAEVRAAGPQVGSSYDFTFTAIDSKALPFSQFRGKVVLVVNTASFCGFTKQYAGLEAIYEKYKERGFVVLGVPSNDFGDQEPGSNAEIATFCQGAFNVTFPLTEKYAVKGEGAHPFYKWAVATLGMSAAPKWNFHKYLVGADGTLIASFATTVGPDAPKLISAIEAALAAKQQ
jgi:glutathione peroxidase